MSYKINKGKKSKSKLVEIISESDSDSEHELFYYSKDRIQLMKEVLKLIKPKKIKAMAPDCLKKVDCEEINSMLLEELLGISNKRLKKILDGQNVEDASSSSEEEDKPISIISLDDISDSEDDLLTGGISTPKNNKKNKCRRHKSNKIKSESKTSDIKQEKTDKAKSSKTKENKQKESIPSATGENDKVLSVLELLELQARARAIRSQLALEAESRAKEVQAIADASRDDSDDDAVALIVEDPKNNQIVISSSDEEGKKRSSEKQKKDKTLNGRIGKRKQKVKLVRLRFDEETRENNTVDNNFEKDNTETSIALNESNNFGKSAEPSNEVVLNIDENIVDNIPLPANKSQNLDDTTSDVNTLDTHNKISISEDNNFASNGNIEVGKEKQNKIFIIDEQIFAKGRAKSNDDNPDNKVINSNLIKDNEGSQNSENDLQKNVKKVRNKNNPDSENDDVINLDFVEIDGIDD